MSKLSRDEVIASLTAPGQPYEMQTIDTDRGPIRVFVNLPQTLRQLYQDYAGDGEFLIYGDERITFRQAYETMGGIARVLVEEFEVAPGDRVAISARNYPEWMLSFGAITSIGAIAVGMNSLWQTEELEYALRDSDPKVFIADKERLEQFRQMPDLGISTLSIRAEGEANDIHRMIESFPGGMPDVDVQPDDPCVILYTSGSTGHPKGVLSTHRAVLHAIFGWELDAVQNAMRGDPEEAPSKWPSCSLLGIPLFHVMGLHGGFLSSFRSQRKTVVMTKWDPAHAAELIERERVTSFSAPPAMTGDLEREARTTTRDLSSMLSVGGGGAARAPEQVRQINETMKVAPSIGWGMTETNALGTLINGKDYLAHPTSAGYAMAPVDLRVVDADDRPLPDGERGELQVRGSMMFREYWRRPDAMRSSFADGGWFRTGDVAYLEDGRLYIVDRIKDLIIRGGENIGCGQVEAALLAHPAVEEAAVYAVPDDRLGEEVGATIHVNAPVDLAELRAFLGQHLAKHEVPRYIWVNDGPLPRIASGKLFKRQLRDDSVARLAAEGTTAAQ